MIEHGMNHAFFGQQFIFPVVIAVNFVEFIYVTIGTNLCHYPPMLGSSLTCSDDWQSFTQEHWECLLGLPQILDHIKTHIEW